MRLKSNNDSLVLRISKISIQLSLISKNSIIFQLHSI